MQQYLELLKTIKEKGTWKDAARANMPRTLSLFGYQMRFNLQEGFPLVTTKKVNFKHIVTELLWFMNGDTNIKYLVDNKCNIWSEDAFSYYKKIASKNTGHTWNAIYMGIQGGKRVDAISTLEVESYSMYTFEEFCDIVKTKTRDELGMYYSVHGYTLGDCGVQYGKLWRNWEYCKEFKYSNEYSNVSESIDQLAELIKGLKNNPTGRRHIISAWDVANLDNMALNACHSFVQFNCRPLSIKERIEIFDKMSGDVGSAIPTTKTIIDIAHKNCDECNIPKYYLDCQMYQRSADVFLGVPYNIASYALLTEILSRICNMIPGNFVHTFGDVHIYENHLQAVEEQLTREPRPLPKLYINTEFWMTESQVCGEGMLSTEGFLSSLDNEYALKCMLESDIQLIDYNPHSTIKAQLSTGLIK